MNKHRYSRFKWSRVNQSKFATNSHTAPTFQVRLHTGTKFCFFILGFLSLKYSSMQKWSFNKKSRSESQKPRSQSNKPRLQSNQPRLDQTILVLSPTNLALNVWSWSHVCVSHMSWELGLFGKASSKCDTVRGSFESSEGSMGYVGREWRLWWGRESRQRCLDGVSSAAVRDFE